jgi:DNA replication protein DnaC
MIQEQTLNKLNQMKLFGMAKSLKDRLERQDHRDITISDFLGLVVDDEWLYRDNKRMKARESGAKFKDKQAQIENIKYSEIRGFTKQQMLEYAQLKWIEKHQNMAVTGKTGVGKSWVAQALGHQACRNGLRVLFTRQPALIHTLMTAKASATMPALLKRFAKIDLLIVDDFGVSIMTEEIRRDLLEVFEERYSSGSTIITSQLPVGEWHEYCGGGRIADALCDRFVRNAHRLEITGPSMRPELKDQNT